MWLLIHLAAWGGPNCGEWLHGYPLFLHYSCACWLYRVHWTVSPVVCWYADHRGKKVDSVICNSQYVVPRACQVLPCYVIDLVATGETFYRSETEPLQAVGRPIQSKVRDRTAPARDETEEQKLQRLKARVSVARHGYLSLQSFRAQG